jgi:hypothetical protein
MTKLLFPFPNLFPLIPNTGSLEFHRLKECSSSTVKSTENKIQHLACLKSFAHVDPMELLKDDLPFISESFMLQLQELT